MNLQSITGMRDMIDDGDLPDWLLVEVLVKLPAKLVFRFKLVSKQWLSLISDPYFVRQYTSRVSLSSQSQSWTYICELMHYEGCPESYFPDYVLLEDMYSQVLKPSYCVLPAPRTQPRHSLCRESYWICGVSNGLVLYNLDCSCPLRECSHGAHFICNPVTGQWIALPPITCPFLCVECGFLTCVEDGILKSYTVVRLDSRVRSNTLNFEVFFSEIGEWKSFHVSIDQENVSRKDFLGEDRENVSRKDFLCMDRAADAVNGVLHWIADDYGIIRYDPDHSPEQMHIVAFPEIVSEPLKERHGLCAVYLGKLGYFEVRSTYSSQLQNIKLWVLNDYRSDDWCLLHKVSLSGVHGDANLAIRSFLAPVSFHPFDSNVVLMGLGFEDLLLSYNIKTKTLEVQQKCSTRKTCKMDPLDPYWQSALLLMIPPWPLSLPGSSSGAT